MDDSRGYTPSMRRLAEEFARLPGIGRKTADRLTYHILRVGRDEAMRLAEAIRDVKDNVQTCPECCNISEGGLCEICADPRRDHGLICIVEQPRDAIAMESVGTYRGVYHVLMGHLAPLEDIGPEDLTVAALVERVRSGQVGEIILATNPNLDGDTTALYIRQQLQPLGVRITRLARGLPTGSSIEHVSANILSDALDGRREVD